MFIRQEVFGNKNITISLPIYKLFIILLIVISVAALTKKGAFQLPQKNRKRTLNTKEPMFC